MTVTGDRQDEVDPARSAVNDMLEAGLLDSVMERAAVGELALTGEGGFLPELVRSVLERGLSTEGSEHLGYEKGDPAGRGSSNSRNGFTPKTVASEVGDVPLAVPRDRQGSFEPRLVPKGSRRTGGLDEMIISLYAGGMTVREFGHHLQRTLGTELERDPESASRRPAHEPPGPAHQSSDGLSPGHGRRPRRPRRSGGWCRIGQRADGFAHADRGRGPGGRTRPPRPPSCDRDRRGDAPNRDQHRGRDRRPHHSQRVPPGAASRAPGPRPRVGLLPW